MVEHNASVITINLLIPSGKHYEKPHMQLSLRHKDPQQAHFFDIPVVKVFRGGEKWKLLIIQTIIFKYLNVRKWLFDGEEKDGGMLLTSHQISQPHSKIFAQNADFTLII